MSMELRNCSRCGKVFQYSGQRVCKSCINAEEGEFRLVKDYLDENPGSKIDEVHEGTGVTTQKILRFLREGRLMATDGLAGVLLCEQCGTSIVAGHYCRTCREKLEQGIRELLPDAKDDESQEGKMHISGFIQDRRTND